MAYRKLGRDNKHRRSMLATLTKQLIENERIVTTETRAKEVRKSFDKMVTYGKRNTLVSRRLALAFLHNDNACVKKVFDDLAPRYADRNGGYTRIIKMQERKGDNALELTYIERLRLWFDVEKRYKTMWIVFSTTTPSCGLM